MKTKEIVLIIMATIFTVSGAFAVNPEAEPILQEKIGSGWELGKFQAVELVNKLTHYRVEVLLNQNATDDGKSIESIKVSGRGEKYFPIPVQSGVKIHSLRLIVRDLQNNGADSDNIELDWQNKDKVVVLQEVVNKLKNKGIDATAEIRNNDTLVITVNKISTENTKTEQADI